MPNYHCTFFLDEDHEAEMFVMTCLGSHNCSVRGTIQVIILLQYSQLEPVLRPLQGCVLWKLLFLVEPTASLGWRQALR